MSIKKPSIVIDNQEPFSNCELGRKKYGNILFGLIENYPSGFVLAINNQWGTGKTTFIKMLQAKLNLHKYSTIYFNAWEQDYNNDPMSAFIGELKILTKRQNSKVYKNLIKTAGFLGKNVVPSITKSLTSSFIGKDTVNEIISATSKGLGDMFEKEVTDYLKRKESINKFKTHLNSFIKEICKEKPLIIFIDELDRCRPDYSVTILEQVKHFFSIENIVFVLSIDKEQLGYAIKGFYGNEGINTEEYLKRFIDIEYQLPDPEYNLYYNFLFNHFEFPRLINERYGKDGSALLQFINNQLELLFYYASKKVTLRKQEKFFINFKIAFTLLGVKEVDLRALLFVMYVKSFENTFYNKLKNKEIEFIDFSNNFSKLFKQKKSDKFLSTLIRVEIVMNVWYHNYYYDIYDNNKLYKRNIDTGSHEILFTLTSTSDNMEHLVMDTIDQYKKTSNSIGLEDIFKLLDLTDSFA